MSETQFSHLQLKVLIDIQFDTKRGYIWKLIFMTPLGGGVKVKMTS